MLQQARDAALAMLLASIFALSSHAQAPPTPPNVTSGGVPRTIGADPLAMARSFVAVPPGCGGGPPACAPYEDRNGPLLIGNPLLDGCPAIPGVVGAIDLGLVVPHITNKLTQPVTLTNGAIDTVHLPTADLGFRVMPRFEVGYRFGQAAGEVTLSYRFLTAEGTQQVSPIDLPGFAPGGARVRSRLDQQLVDLDYGCHESSLGPLWDMKWQVGLRFVNNYADSQGINATLAQQTTDRYWGIGPHVMLDLRRSIPGTGVAVFGRVESSLPIGRVEQRYTETREAATGATGLQQNMPILSLAFQAGFSWSPTGNDQIRVTAGYSFEHWWDLGAIGVTAGAPREELSIQGGFLRAEWNY